MMPSCSASLVYRGAKTIMRSDMIDKAVTDFSWLCPNSTLTCWQKFYSFYQKKQLFSTIANDADNDKEDNYKFSNHQFQILLLSGKANGILEKIMS